MDVAADSNGAAIYAVMTGLIGVATAVALALLFGAFMTHSFSIGFVALIHKDNAGHELLLL